MGIAGTPESTTPLEDRNLWAAPQELVDYASKQYGPFDLDAAANFVNHKCDLWLGPESPLGVYDSRAILWTPQALHLPSKGRFKVWCNPPYDNPGPFVRAGFVSARWGGSQVTMLLPSTTEVRWWHEFVWDTETRRFQKGVEVEFLTPRVRYIKPDGTRGGSPKFGSALITFY